MSYIRVVRFTDVDPARVDAINARAEEAGGPPEGVPSTGIKVLVDADQRTAVVLQYFDSLEDMETAERALDAMDPGDTPGTRVSIDRTEVKVALGVA